MVPVCIFRQPVHVYSIHIAVIIKTETGVPHERIRVHGHVAARVKYKRKFAFFIKDFFQIFE